MKLLDEDDVEECLNVDNDVPRVLQLTDSEIVYIIVNPDRGTDTDDDDNEVSHEEEKTLTDKCISLTEELIPAWEGEEKVSKLLSIYVGA
jgi:hypothetical protein